MNIEQSLSTVKVPVLDSSGQVKTAKVDTPAPVPVKVDAPVVTVETVKAAAQQIDLYLKSTGRNLDIRVDEQTGQTVVTVHDTATGDVIRQIPNEEALRLARSLGDGGSALLNTLA